MKYLLNLLFFVFITANSYACPLEPILGDVYSDNNVHWRLDPSLGIVVRFMINGSFAMYAHPEVAPIGQNFGCIPHPRGGCRTMIVYPKLKEIVFVDDKVYHTASLNPSMCRMEGEDWKAFYRISYGERIK